MIKMNESFMVTFSNEKLIVSAENPLIVEHDGKTVTIRRDSPESKESCAQRVLNITNDVEIYIDLFDQADVKLENLNAQQTELKRVVNRCSEIIGQKMKSKDSDFCDCLIPEDLYTNPDILTLERAQQLNIHQLKEFSKFVDGKIIKLEDEIKRVGEKRFEMVNKIKSTSDDLDSCDSQEPFDLVKHRNKDLARLKLMFPTYRDIKKLLTALKLEYMLQCQSKQNLAKDLFGFWGLDEIQIAKPFSEKMQSLAIEYLSDKIKSSRIS